MKAKEYELFLQYKRGGKRKTTKIKLEIKYSAICFLYITEKGPHLY